MHLAVVVPVAGAFRTDMLAEAEKQSEALRRRVAEAEAEEVEAGAAVAEEMETALEKTATVKAAVVLTAEDLDAVPRARALSTATMRNIRQNLVWAFGYNVALLPVAAGVFYPLTGWLLSPMLAAGAMAASSVLVVTNALRLGRLRLRKDAQ